MVVVGVLDLVGGRTIGVRRLFRGLVACGCFSCCGEVVVAWWGLL